MIGGCLVILEAALLVVGGWLVEILLAGGLVVLVLVSVACFGGLPLLRGVVLAVLLLEVAVLLEEEDWLFTLRLGDVLIVALVDGSVACFGGLPLLRGVALVVLLLEAAVLLEEEDWLLALRFSGVFEAVLDVVSVACFGGLPLLRGVALVVLLLAALVFVVLAGFEAVRLGADFGGVFFDFVMGAKVSIYFEWLDVKRWACSKFLNGF